jgi:hypothetical protein
MDVYGTLRGFLILIETALTHSHSLSYLILLEKILTIFNDFKPFDWKFFTAEVVIVWEVNLLGRIHDKWRCLDN